MVPIVASAIGLHLTSVASSILGDDDEIDAVGVHEASAAPGESKDQQDHRQALHGPPLTQMNETRALSSAADRNMAFAMCGPASSQSALDANPGTEPIARTSAGNSRNHTTNDHMGCASASITLGRAI